MGLFSRRHLEQVTPPRSRSSLARAPLGVRRARRRLTHGFDTLNRPAGGLTGGLSTGYERADGRAPEDVHGLCFVRAGRPASRSPSDCSHEVVFVSSSGGRSVHGVFLKIGGPWGYHEVRGVHGVTGATTPRGTSMGLIISPKQRVPPWGVLSPLLESHGGSARSGLHGGSSSRGRNRRLETSLADRRRPGGANGVIRAVVRPDRRRSPLEQRPNSSRQAWALDAVLSTDG